MKVVRIVVVEALVGQCAVVAMTEVADAEFVEDKDGDDGGGEGDETSAVGVSGWMAGAVVAAASESHGEEMTANAALEWQQMVFEVSV